MRVGGDSEVVKEAVGTLDVGGQQEGGSCSADVVLSVADPVSVLKKKVTLVLMASPLQATHSLSSAG